MSYWIFRGNREDFDIDTYLRDFSYIYWAVKHEKHRSEIKIGDRVFIWRSKGKSKDAYGAVALGTVVEKPIHKENVSHPELLLETYWQKREVSPYKVGIEIDSVRLSLEDGMIDSSLLLADPELAGMHLLTARQGTNFKLSEYQFNKMLNLWNGAIYDA